jgi:hypothetical protein
MPGFDTYPRPDLLGLVAQSSIRDSTDPGDHIFGVLGLSGEANATPSIVNYDKLVAQVFIDFAVDALVRRNSMDILSMVGAHKLSDLPSWVPDWSNDTAVMDTPSLHGINYLHSWRNAFYAGGHHAEPKVKVSPDQRVLFTQRRIIKVLDETNMQNLLRTTLSTQERL